MFFYWNPYIFVGYRNDRFFPQTNSYISNVTQQSRCSPMHISRAWATCGETNDNLIQDIQSRNVQLNSWQAFKNLGMDFVDLWRCGRIRCLHLIRIASCKTWSCSYSTYSGFEFWVLRFRDLGASFWRFGCFVFEFGVLRASVFVFECLLFKTTDWR